MRKPLTPYLTLDQVVEKLNGYQPLRARKPRVKNGDTAQHIANRRILRRAYLIVKDDPAEKKVLQTILLGFRSPPPIRSSILETARAVITAALEPRPQR